MVLFENQELTHLFLGTAQDEFSRKTFTPISKDENIAYQKFLDDPQLRQWTTRSKPDPEIVTYYLRIDFESSCLSCHGPKASRPEFVVKKYPEDKAYDFSPKDLRAVYQFVQTLKANTKEQRKEEKSW